MASNTTLTSLDLSGVALHGHIKTPYTKMVIMMTMIRDTYSLPLFVTGTSHVKSRLLIKSCA